jgi:hypothetical protein
VDHFCDQDLFWCTCDRLKFDELDELPETINRMCRNYSFDFAIATSGAEEIEFPVPVYGTPREKIGQFLDKEKTQSFFENLGVPLPALASPGEYPVMAKPARGAGGWRNAVIDSETREQAWAAEYPGVPYIRQKVVSGIPASVCCVCDGKHARAVATNEQILRGSGASAFGFAGSVTPFSHPLSDRMREIAETIAAASGCVGTIGIDFVVSDTTPYAIEINPRFQGTVDTVELATGASLFDLHVNACKGNLSAVRQADLFAARRIIFADRDMTVSADLKKCAPMVSDIPWPGAFFEEDQAIVSVSGTGATRAEALKVLDKNISSVRQYIC